MVTVFKYSDSQILEMFVALLVCFVSPTFINDIPHEMEWWNLIGYAASAALFAGIFTRNVRLRWNAIRTINFYGLVILLVCASCQCWVDEMVYFVVIFACTLFLSVKVGLYNLHKTMQKSRTTE